MGNEAEAREILRLVRIGTFKLTEHAFARSSARNITRAQIIHCAKHCIWNTWQEEHGTHLFVGYLDGVNTGGFSAIYKNGAVVVTVFKRRLTEWEKRRVKKFQKR